MKIPLAAIVLAIAISDTAVAANQCYVCSYVEGLFEDHCSPDKFDPSSFLVMNKECDGGKCYKIASKDELGTKTYVRGCTSQELPGVPSGSIVCGEDGVKCCDGNFCNGETGTDKSATSDQCYVCGFVEDMFEDHCSPDKFDPSSFMVMNKECHGGKCYTANIDVSGTKMYSRGCTSQELPGVPAGSVDCGENGVKCCDGNLCNGASVKKRPSFLGSVLRPPH